MEKLYEKKNFGMPTTLFCVIAYLIGYLLSRSTGGEALLVAALFAAIVFAFNFDGKIRNAVQQAYMFAFFKIVIDICFDLLRRFTEIVSPKELNVSSVISYSGDEMKEILKNVYNLNAFSRALVYIYKYGLDIIGVAFVVLFLIFIIRALLKKEVKFNFITKLLDETPVVAPVYQQQMYQQPQMQPQMQPQQVQQPQMQPQQVQQPQMQPQQVQQQIQPQQQVQQPQQQPQQVQQPQANAGLVCQNCGKNNQPGAGFCASCGTKLN